MKKVLLILVALIGISYAANAQQDKARVPGDSGNTVLVSVSDDSQTSSTITFYNNSTKSIEVCVLYSDFYGKETKKRFPLKRIYDIYIQARKQKRTTA